MRAESKNQLKRLLSYAEGEERAESAADALSERFGVLSDIAESSPSALRAVGGISDKSVMLLLLASEATSRRVTDKFSFGVRHKPSEIIDYLKGLFIGESEERIFLICFDGKMRTVSCDLAGSGAVNGSAFSVRRIVELAVLRGAKYAVLAHNHPVGFAEPSGDDIISTEAIAAALRTVRVELLSHHVISGMNASRSNGDMSVDRLDGGDMLKVASPTGMKN
jgi:DNA repair protein RadC